MRQVTNKVLLKPMKQTSTDVVIVVIVDKSKRMCNVVYNSCMNRRAKLGLDLDPSSASPHRFTSSPQYASSLGHSTSYANRQLLCTNGPAPCPHVKPACSLKGYNLTAWPMTSVGTFFLLYYNTRLPWQNTYLHLTTTFNPYKPNFSSCH